MTVDEVKERERVMRALAELEEAHKDPAYRNAVLAALFAANPELFQPANDYVN